MSSWRDSRRGSFRGRSSWRSAGSSSGRASWQSSLQRDNSSPLVRAQSPPTGIILSTINHTAVMLKVEKEMNEQNNPKIQKCEYVGSYNWLENESHTLLVPGAPPTWTPLDEARTLERDEGKYFRDPNAARWPSRPMEPAVQAVLLENKDLDGQDIDLFACSSTLGSLLRFVRREEKPFRFFVEAVGNTVFFIRHENSPDEVIPDVKGYGHTFPEAYTTWGENVEGSVSHQRILRYDFAGLDCMVRFECDGYLRDELATNSDLPPLRIVPDLEARIAESSNTAAEAGEADQLRVRPAGFKVPQKTVLDLKTRGGWKPHINTWESVLEKELARCWLTQIPNFILARYSQPGVFDDIHVSNIAEDVQKWEQNNKTVLSQLGCLIRTIIEKVQSQPDKKIEIRCKDLDKIELRRQDSDDHDVLPLWMKDRWVGGDMDESTGWEELEYESEGRASYSASESDLELDYTACSAESCGYCGKCSY